MPDNLVNKKIILASKSPRRQELLKGLDLVFETRTKDVDESYPSDMPATEIPVYLADKKAKAFIHELDTGEVIITSDTIVIQDGEVLEKPASAEEAIRMISKLSDHSHEVVTGVCIQSADKKVLFSDTTRVHFKPLAPNEVEYYVKKYQPYDKAGAYGVQEWIGYIGIYKLEGSYYNVMGLPVHKVYAALKDF